MQLLANDKFQCNVVQDCLGFNLSFADGSNAGISKLEIGSLTEWIETHNNKYIPLAITPDNIDSFRAILDKVYRVLEPTFRVEDDSKEISVISNLIYMKKSWVNWFEIPIQAKNLGIPRTYGQALGEWQVPNFDIQDLAEGNVAEQLARMRNRIR